LAPLLHNDRRRIELMNALLFSLPGAPVIYYGDEIGMGDNIYLGDRNGVRTPMQWSPDRNAGFSRANPQKLYLPTIIDPEYHFESINVEAQQNNPTSLLWWMKHLIALRKRFKAFSRGKLELLRPQNPKILAFIRSFDGERILVVANLSRFVQYVELNLKEYQGMVPHELFGGNEFPPVGELPYLLTLGPHAFYWFALAPTGTTKRARGARLAGRELPVLAANGGWERLFHNSNQPALEALLPEFLARRRMAPGLGRVLSATIEDVQTLGKALNAVRLLVLRLEYDTSETETTILPLVPVAEDQAGRLLEPVEAAALVRLAGKPSTLVCDALAAPDYCLGLLQMLGAGTRQSFRDGELVAVPLPGFAETCTAELEHLKPAYNPGERGDPSILFGDRAVYKAYRRLEAGINPDLEMSRFLNTPGRFHGVAPLLGYFEYCRPGAEPTSLAVLHCYVPNQGDAWQLTLDQLSGYVERVLALPGARRQQPLPPGRLLDLIPAPHEKDELAELIGPYLPLARQLGERTGELHQALASDRADPVFAPETYTRAYQRSFYQSLRNLAGQVMERLGSALPDLEPAVQDQARRLLEQEGRLLRLFRQVLDRPLGGVRIRCHGNLRLRQLLHTGNDFVFVGFEGDPTRPVSERRIKRSPLCDVADLVHSLNVAVQASLRGLGSEHGKAPGLVRAEDRPMLMPWGEAWHGRVARELVAAYFERTGNLVPPAPEGRQTLLEMLLLEQALRDIVEELIHRREWVVVPLSEALRVLAGAE
jgi:maltose alpha-D-glucosyltransferase/alpha-amylase